MTKLKAIRVGCVPYLVAKPLIDGLDQSSGIEMQFDVPSRLVRGLRESRIDVALASAIEVFRNPGYSVIPNLCIAADGEVMSVRLFLRKPFDQLRRIALDPSSETANSLLRILFSKSASQPIEWVQVQPGQNPEQIEADAYLRIGDEALRQLAVTRLDSLDLSLWWKELTGLPFVFAVWMVRPGVVIQDFLPKFIAAARKGVSEREKLIEPASKELMLPPYLLRRYLVDCCRYQLGNREFEALHRFRDFAAELDLASPQLKIQFAQ